VKITLIALVAAAALVAPAMAFAQGGKTTMETEVATKPTPTKSGHIKANGVKSIAAVDRIIGCPHEEGVDYPAHQTAFVGAVLDDIVHFAELGDGISRIDDELDLVLPVLPVPLPGDDALLVGLAGAEALEMVWRLEEVP
jgi:hypothetical protein